MADVTSVYSDDVFENTRTRVVVVSEGRMLLLRPHAPDEGWLLPGGGMEHGESLFECAAREVMEETGIAVVPTGVVFVREWIVPRFAEPIAGDPRVGYGIEVYIWAPLEGPAADPAPVLRKESPFSRTPEWVSLPRVQELAIWPVEIRELAIAIESGKSISLTPWVTGVLQSPYEQSPPVDFGLQAEV